MTKAIEQQTNNLFSDPTSSGVSCLSANVGSMSDFLFPLMNSSSATILSDPDNRLPTMIITDTDDGVHSDDVGELNLSMSKEKLGHRRVDEIGNVTYKKVMVDELIKSLQISLKHAIGQCDQPQRQVLLQDFQQTDYQDFPS
jgi:hypothetical protein